MADALKQINKKIFFAMANQGEEKSYKWAKIIANSWRTA